MRWFIPSSTKKQNGEEAEKVEGFPGVIGRKRSFFSDQKLKNTSTPSTPTGVVAFTVSKGRKGD